MGSIAFDLDGTLFDWRNGHAPNYDDPEAMRAGILPHPFAVEHVRSIARMAPKGTLIVYLTGRSNPVRGVTLEQIATARLPPGRVEMQDSWRGFDFMLAYKARALRNLGAVLYVGDHDVDEEAARLAGVPFVHADEWRSARHVPVTARLALRRLIAPEPVRARSIVEIANQTATKVRL